MLSGVVYHNGADFRSGHYTSLCRGPAGGFWFYDDSAVRRMDQEIAHIKPKEVYMLVYCQADGGARWSKTEAGSRVAGVLDDPSSTSNGRDAGSPGASPGGCRMAQNTNAAGLLVTPTRRLGRKTSVVSSQVEDEGASPRRRIVRKSSDCALAETLKRRMWMTSALGAAVTPTRRLVRKTSAEDAAFPADLRSLDVVSPIAPFVMPSEVGGEEVFHSGAIQEQCHVGGQWISSSPLRRRVTDVASSSSLVRSSAVAGASTPASGVVPAQGHSLVARASMLKRRRQSPSASTPKRARRR